MPMNVAIGFTLLGAAMAVASLLCLCYKQFVIKYLRKNLWIKFRYINFSLGKMNNDDMEMFSSASFMRLILGWDFSYWEHGILYQTF